jgi:pimeloyl-ACP methyl ester carboxylesterase
MRQLLAVRLSRHDLVGTCHVPSHRALSGQKTQVGFLFLNAGHLPRDGHAGISTNAAESIAAMGHPVFRFDLPGLGDSPGQVPQTTDALFRMIHDGWFTEPARLLVQALCRRFQIPRLVLGGLCGAAGTALLVAQQEPYRVAGVVGIETEFFYPCPEPPVKSWQALLSRAAWLRLITGHSQFSSALHLPQTSLTRLVGRRLLPPHTDFALVSAWTQCVQRGMPVLLVMAEGKRRHIFYDQVQQSVLAGSSPGNLSVMTIAGTNHILTTGGAQPIVVRAMEAWAEHNFGRPQEPLEDDPPSVSQSPSRRIASLSAFVPEVA